MKSPTMRITAISLARRPDRWSAIEAHLQQVVPTELVHCIDVFAGTDARAHLPAGVGAGEEAIRALERATGCTIYRGWPITEVDDVRRCFPAVRASSDAEAWIAYERSINKLWKADRARLFIDFFFRHMTIGDVGACLAHLRLAERARAEGCSLQLIVEDDCRLTPGAVPALLAEVAVLDGVGIEWDIIYLQSTHYGRRPEAPVHASSTLLYAGHRKAHMCYALSTSGARKIAEAGLRDALLPYDEWLPALHSCHPRLDVMALPSVRKGRGELAADDADEAGGTGVGATGAVLGATGAVLGTMDAVLGADDAPFVALTFPDESGLCVPPGAAASASGRRSGRPKGATDSDSKAVSGSLVLLGDAGVCLDDGLQDEPDDDADAALLERTDLPDAMQLDQLLVPPERGPRAECAALAADGVPEHVAGAVSGAVSERLQAQLEAHSYALVRVNAGALEVLLEAEVGAIRFFSQPTAWKAKHAGPGGRVGQLLLWSCGFTSWPNRQQWHVVCGAPDAPSWPMEAADGNATLETVGSRELRTSLMGAEACLRELAMACLQRLGGADVPKLRERCEAMGSGTDPSVIDAFFYAAVDASSAAPAAAPKADGEQAGCASKTMQMAAHVDPGILTLTRASECPGIEIFDGARQGWVAVEALAAPDEVVVFAGEQLEKASRGRIRAARHRVAPPPPEHSGEDRISVVFELRAPGVK